LVAEFAAGGRHGEHENGPLDSGSNGPFPGHDGPGKQQVNSSVLTLK
jgi:hypothetical protein